MDDPFDMHEQYQHYLQMCGFDEQKMSFDQRSEIKKAFMYGMYQMMLILKHHLPDLPPEFIFKTFEGMMYNAEKYFIKANENLN